jgi:hypothetical protein
VVSWGLLVLIGGIGAWVYLKGQRFDEGLFALDASLLKDLPPAREQVKLYEPGFEPGAPALAREPEEARPADSGKLSGIVPEGWEALGPVEAFSAETLYEKINGRAEQYLAYGVKGLEFAGLSRDGKFLDVFLYDMGAPAHAFGIYSVERNEGMPPANLGREGYRVEASTFFWKGPYYVQVIASDVGPALEEAGKAVAEALAGRLEDDGSSLWGLAELPPEGRVAGTEKYYLKNATP